MKAEFIGREINTINITMELTAEELTAAINTVFQRNRKNIVIPGFRKGKAPRNIVQKYYGKDIFMEDALTEAFNKFYPEALDQFDYEPVHHPEVSVVGDIAEEGKPVTFDVKFLTTPIVHLDNYKGVEVKVPPIVVTDDDVELSLKSTAQRNARLLPVERAAELNDTVTIDYKGFDSEGTQFEGGTADNFQLKLGSGRFIPGFEEQLVGAVAGDSREVRVAFPDEYPEENLAGKPVLFNVDVKEVFEEELPPIDDDLARECSEFDTLEEWKVDLKKNMLASRDQSRRTMVRNEVMQILGEQAIVDIPEEMIDQEVENRMRQFDQQLGYSGVSLEEYLEQAHETIDDFKSNIREDAERILRSSLIVQDIAKREGLEATEEELDEEIRKMGVQYGLKPEQMREVVGNDIKYVRRDICAKKAMEILVDEAVVIEFAAGEAVETSEEE